MRELFMNADGGAPEGGATPEVPATTETPSLFSDEQQAALDKMIQSAQDKVRTEYSKKLKALENEKTELERAKMTEDERKAAEQAELSKTLQEKEQALLARELELKTIDLLKDNDLPLDFKPFIVDVSEEQVAEKVQAFKKLWQSALKTAVENKFKESGRTPHQATNSTAITKEQFVKMTYNEKLEIFQTNPELYKELAKH